MKCLPICDDDYGNDECPAAFDDDSRERRTVDRRKSGDFKTHP